MHPETRMFLINKFLAEVVKPISRIEAARRAKNIASGSGGRLGLGDARSRKPKLTGMGSGAKGFPLDLGGGREARTLPTRSATTGLLRGREGEFTKSKRALTPSTTYAAQEPGRILRMQAKKRKEKGPARQTDPEKAGVTKSERGMMSGRGVGAPKPKQPTIRDYSSIKSKVKAGRRQISGAIKTGASKVGGVVSGAAKKTVDTVKTQTKPGLDPSIGPSDSRYGRKAGRKPTLTSDILGGLKAAGKSVKDTALKQQVGMQADAYADSFNIAGGRRMGPDYGATGRKTDRAQGVENIRSGIKQQIGTVTKTDDQGNVISAKAGVLNPQRLQRRFRARVTQRAQQERLAKGDYSDFDTSRVDLPSYDVTDADGRTRTIGAGRQKPSDAGIAAATTQAIEKKRTQIDDLTVERSKLDKADKKGKKALDKKINRLKRGIKRAEVAQAKVQSRTRAGRAATGEQELDQILSQKVSEPGAPRRFEVPLASGDKITISQNVTS